MKGGELTAGQRQLLDRVCRLSGRSLYWTRAAVIGCRTRDLDALAAKGYVLTRRAGRDVWVRPRWLQYRLWERQQA